MNQGIIRKILPIGLAVGLLWYVLKDVPLAELGNQFRQADYCWLTLVGILICLYQLTRAARWQLTLQAIGYQPSLFRTLVSLLAGTMASMLIPGAGELTRCGTLQRTDGIPMAQGIGSVVAERVVDMAMLLVIIGLTVLLEFKRVGQYILDILLPIINRLTPSGHPNSLFIGLSAICLVFIILIYRLLQTDSFWQHRLVIRLLGIVKEIKRGFLSIQQLKRPGLFILLTFLCYGLFF